MPYDSSKARRFGTYNENEDVRVTEPVSEGPHEVQVTDLKFDNNSNGEYVGLRMKVFGDSDPDNGREFTDFFTLNEENRGFPNDMKRLNTVMALSGVSDFLEDLKGKAVGVNVVHRINKASDKTFANVVSYFRAKNDPPEDIPF